MGTPDARARACAVVRGRTRAYEYRRSHHFDCTRFGVALASQAALMICARRALEQRYRGVWTQMVEFKRLSVQQLESVAPEELARLQWQWLRRETQRRQERLQ